MKNIRFTFAVQKYYFFLTYANNFALLARILYYIGKKTNAYETDFFSFDGYDAVRRHGECVYEEG
jgi:hypothetical protein